jgi:octaprenyl-diphosphate synthase
VTAHNTTSAARQDSVQYPAAYERVRPELGRVVALITRQIECADESLAPMMQHIMASSGSLVRPVLVLLSGKCLGRLSVAHVKIGAVVEMLHIATLVHDDVIDHASLRRGWPSLNSLWGNDCAVLAGDCLLARAFGVAGELQSIQMNRLLADTAQTMCRGELKQNLLRGKWDISEGTYRDIIKDKTAGFFSACCVLGAIASKAGSARTQHLADFGLNLGMAFQHIDDLLDIIGDETTIRKERGSDIANAKLTLAFIKMLEKLDDSRRTAAIKKLNASKRCAADFLDELSQTGALRYVFDVAARHIEKAVSCLRRLDNCDVAADLAEIAHSVTARIDKNRLS